METASPARPQSVDKKHMKTAPLACPQSVDELLMETAPPACPRSVDEKHMETASRACPQRIDGKLTAEPCLAVAAARSLVACVTADRWCPSSRFRRSLVMRFCRPLANRSYALLYPTCHSPTEQPKG